MPGRLVSAGRLALLGLLLAGIGPAGAARAAEGAEAPVVAPALPVPGFEAGFAACRGLASDAARLGCYDALPVPEQAANLRFNGAGSALTAPFDVGTRARLSFTSDDAIFVAYLLDPEGRVVQNLHRGGAGQGEFLIEAPGRYRLQINASGGWRVELRELP